MVGVAVRPRAAAADCVGNCSGDSEVTIDELIVMVNIALEVPGFTVADCDAGDQNGDGAITVDEITTAMNYALQNPGFTCTVGPTPTPVTAVCGNGIVETGEDCDIGGTCIGNAKAGTHCTSDADCGGSGVGGVCEAGFKPGSACSADTDCPASKCIRCKVFEGKTLDNVNCAANCTSEQEFAFNLVPGEPDPDDPLLLKAGTSGAEVNGGVYLQLPIGNGCQGGPNDSQPCVNFADCPGGGVCIPATQTFLVGKDRGDGNIPMVIKAASVRFLRIDVGGLACACIRGLAYKTCGGTIFESDGVTQSTPCTSGFGTCESTHHCSTATNIACTTNDDCAGEAICSKTNGLPCTLVHGENNTASGFAGCGANCVEPVNYRIFWDADGLPPPPTPPSPLRSGRFSGKGPPGSVVLLNTTSIGTAVGACSGSDATVYGPDGQFCTSDDPQASRGTPQTVPLTTGQVTCEIANANSSRGAANGVTIGPFLRTGEVFSCAALRMGEFQGGRLVACSVSLAQPTTGDSVVTSQFSNLNHLPTPVVTPTPSECACLRSGCSGEVCAERPITTICLWLPWYACYRTALCEGQPNGLCGWTPTESLLQCLADPPR